LSLNVFVISKDYNWTNINQSYSRYIPFTAILCRERRQNVVNMLMLFVDCCWRCIFMCAAGSGGVNNFYCPARHSAKTRPHLDFYGVKLFICKRIKAATAAATNCHKMRSIIRFWPFYFVGFCFGFSSELRRPCSTGISFRFSVFIFSSERANRRGETGGLGSYNTRSFATERRQTFKLMSWFVVNSFFVSLFQCSGFVSFTSSPLYII